MPPRLPLVLPGSKPIMGLGLFRALSTTPAVSRAADMKSTSARFLYELDSPPSSTSKTNGTGNGNARQRQRGGAGNGPLLSSEPIQNLLYSSHRTRASQQKREERTRRDEQRRTSEEYLQQMPRLWRGGDVLAPHDLSASEMRKWRRRPTRTGDVIDLLGINPLDHYSNFNLISEFITAHGNIKHSAVTGLGAKNQRKVTKMIRRAIGLGIHPSVHFHPEILQRTWPKN